MLLHPRAEQRAVDGALDLERSDESLHAQRTEEGGGLPPAERSFFHQSRAACRATVAPRHVGFSPCFIEEHRLAGIELRL